MKTFDLNSLNLGDLLSNDELTTLDAGSFINVPAPDIKQPQPGYTEATIIWSQIP